jgi:Big-like domain-containing protein
MIPRERNSIAAALTSLMVLASCSASDGTGPPGGRATLVVTANVSATAAVTVVVEVTASDIATPLVFNIPVVSGVASGTIALPAGSNRTISIRAFDAGGTQTHQGSVTVNIAGGNNPTISLVLTPLTGDVPVVATIGSLTVTVTPSPAAVGVGLTVTLTATITANGTPVTATVTWATRNPGVASVTSAGVVTGMAAGQTSIVATFQGVAGSATVTVGP